MDNFFINICSCIYAWIDLFENLYIVSVCDSFYAQTSDVSSKEEIHNKYVYYIIYKVFASIPFSIFQSFIVINLTYRSAISLIDYLIRNLKTTPPSIKLKKHNEDSFFCNLLCVNDENELIYSKYDIDYVIQLLHGKENNKKPLKLIKKYDYFKHQTLDKSFYSKIVNFFKKKIDWDDNFRFTARFMNTIVVAVVSLYYFVLYLSYNMAYLGSIVSTYLDTALKFINSVNGLEVNVGQFLCDLSEDICIDALNRSFKLPTLPIYHFQDVWCSVIAIFVVPLVASLLICLLQLYFLTRDAKTHITELYKGTCQFVVKATDIPNASIASSSFHFGGLVKF